MGPIPIQKKKQVEKEWDRGDYAEVFHGDFTVAVWKDNKPVYMGSNVFQAEPTHPATRYSRVEKKRIIVGKKWDKIIEKLLEGKWKEKEDFFCFDYIELYF